VVERRSVLHVIGWKAAVWYRAFNRLPEGVRAVTAIVCACGSVCLEAIGHSMMTVICHCTSCRTAGRAFDARSPVAPIVDGAGGTPVVLWRKDRVRCVRGGQRLVAHRLAPEAPSRRMIASCCETPMFGDFTKGFWVSIYRGRVTDAPAPSHARNDERCAGWGGIPRRDGVPRFRGRPGKFLVKLLTTWAAMGFRNPRLAGVPD
jgi:hypothetical protein